MKNNRISCYVLALFFLLVSCKDEVKNEEAPTVSITSPEADTRLWLDITIAAEVVNDQIVSKVMFYLDDELLEEDTESPYELTFDSKQYEDGIHTLKAIAYNKTANQSEATRDIEIFNKLLKVTVEENHFNNSETISKQGWIVVTDIESRVLDQRRLEDGKSINIQRPSGFSDDKIQVLLLKEWKENTDSFSSNQIFINEYHNVSLGDWTLKSDGNPRSNSIGKATLAYTKNEDVVVSIDYKNILEIRSSSYNNDAIVNIIDTLSLFDEPASVFIQTQTGNQKPDYAFVNDIRAGSSYSLAQSDFAPMTLWQNITLPTNDYVLISIYGTSPMGYTYRVFDRFDFYKEVSEISAYIPDNLFSDYNYYLEFERGSFGYSQKAKGKPNATYDIPQVNLQIDDDKRESFSATVDYEADYSTNFWLYKNSSDLFLEKIHWYVYDDISDGSIQAKGLDIPSELLDIFPLLKEHMNDIVHTSTVLRKDNGIDSVSDFVKSYYGSDSESIDYESIQIDATTENGRTSQENFSTHSGWNKVLR